MGWKIFDIDTQAWLLTRYLTLTIHILINLDRTLLVAYSTVLKLDSAVKYSTIRAWGEHCMSVSWIGQISNKRYCEQCLLRIPPPPPPHYPYLQRVLLTVQEFEIEIISLPLCPESLTFDLLNPNSIGNILDS